MSKKKKIYLQIDKEKGEIVCPKCNGSCVSSTYTGYCRKCKNVGKIYWIDKIIQDPGLVISFNKSTLHAQTRQLKATWTIDIEQEMKICMSDDVIQELADEIDEAMVQEILEKYKTLKKNRRYKKWLARNYK